MMISTIPNQLLDLGCMGKDSGVLKYY